MSVVWFNQKFKQGLATLCESNITLNKTAVKNFEGSEAVFLGIDYNAKDVVIKPCQSDKEGSFKITVAPSYGRITNKLFMNEVMKLLDTSLTNPLKLNTEWDEGEKQLIIHLKGKAV